MRTAVDVIMVNPDGMGVGVGVGGMWMTVLLFCLQSPPHHPST
jgi:hypothetical protein